VRLKPETFEPGRARFIGAAFGWGASFAGAAFGERACFTGAVFGDFASFDGVAFGDGARFDGAVFGDFASFHAVFGDWSRFDGATFGDSAIFYGAVFGQQSTFVGAAVGDEANFSGAAFGGKAAFTGAAFGIHVSFMEVAFHGFAGFAGAAFGSGALFSGSVFNGDADFTGISKEQWTATLGALFSRMHEEAFMVLKQRHEESWKRRGSGPDRFLAIWFPSARFSREASFSDRSFEKSADFSGARFYYAPEFDWTGNFARFDFKGAKFGLARPGKLHRTAGTKLPSLLRTMRKAAEEARDHDFERDLYIAERNAELGINWHTGIEMLKKEGRKNWPRNAARLAIHSLWIFIMFLYSVLADYGRSLVRPFVCWLVLSLIVFPWLYGEILPVPQTAGSLNADKYEQAVQMVARANAVPFVGPLAIDSDIKKFLFCLHDKDCLVIPPHGYQWLVVGQNLLSIILFFFIGLALRNYFKIK
jgi:hypothetical protein